jgi:hypothetical protein
MAFGQNIGAMPNLPPKDYFCEHYAADFAVFGGNMLCGFTLTDSLMPDKRSKFKGIAEFVVCQFELNLLNQSIYAYARQCYSAWRAFSVPFADTKLCSMGHGMANHLPPSILRFAQEPRARPGTESVPMTWDIVAEYTKFFLGDYLSQFRATASGRDFPLDSFLVAIGKDGDCSACLKNQQGWEWRHVVELM